LPQPSVDQELLNNADAKNMKQVHNSRLINYLDAVITPPELGEPLVTEFTVELFRVLKYAGGN